MDAILSVNKKNTHEKGIIMKEKLKRAIDELSNFYKEFKQVEILDVIKSDEIKYIDEVVYCRSINQALLLLVNHINDSHVHLNNNFNTFGTMIDLSRNAVFTVEYMKEVIRKQALMGVNRIMLYTEDTYEVEGEPYFGYMRGRYTKNEIKEIVDYAGIFDIEIIPCIQTLGHMGQFLRWGHSSHLKDLQTVLMTEIDEVYVFIEKLIISCKQMYNTKQIHIGLDETFGLGFGRYYKMFGYKGQYEVFIQHLNKVNEICLKHGFEQVMMWSDMFFRISSQNEEYYDLNIEFDEHIKRDIPNNVELVYWDYYNYKQEIVDGMIKKHLEIKDQVIMASGTWIWTKLTYDKKKTDQTARVHIDSCVSNKVKSLYFTQWNDDGAPCNYNTSFLGLFEMAAYALTKTQTMNSEVLEYIIGIPSNEALYSAKLNECPVSPLPLLWDDPLLGIYLNNEDAKDSEIIDKAILFFDEYLRECPTTSDFDTQHTIKIAQLLKNKLVFRKDLLNKYHKKEKLSSLVTQCEEIIRNLEDLLLSFRTMWISRYKAFGLDVIKSRLATSVYRYKETIIRIGEYDQQLVNKIDELEERVGPYQYIRMNHMNVAYSSIHVLSY